ncbi:MAG: glycosyltransferase family 2 protein, partial [Candidatus Yanofskybacteria bacterium]|nr:glycosyltransferase family 2 protein [Candidatus Yanofskybacteria bacterium]
MKKPKTNIPTITVGIPAHNEQENISHILQSVLNQKQSNYKLEKIVVLCDACTDDTAKKARQMAKKYPLITVLDDGERKGKTGRLNQLYRMNKSDLVFNIDGDVILSGDQVLEKLVAAFEEKDVVLVSGNNQPAKALTLVERIDNAGYRMWYEIRKDYLDGHNIWNIQGMTVGLRDSFAKSFQYPEEFYVSDGGFVFITAKEQKKQFRFIKDAVIIFRLVSNLRDFFLQASRSLHQ